VICDTKDFGIGRRVCAENWNALRAAGESANQSLCNAEAADARPAPDVATFCRVTRPSTTADGLYAAGLRFSEPRVTYDLRRLKRKGLIEKMTQVHRYRLTRLGREVAVLSPKPMAACSLLA